MDTSAKDVTINEEVRAEIDVTVYDVICSGCNNSIGFDVSADRDNDLTITVEPCSRCSARD